MPDEIPSFDDPEENEETETTENKSVRSGSPRRWNALSAVVACVIAGLLMAAGFVGAQKLLPEHAPDARTLAAETIQNVKQARSFSFHGTLEAQTTADFLPSGEQIDFRGVSSKDGFRVTVGDKNPFVLLVNKSMIFMRIDGEWVKIPQRESAVKQQVKAAVAQPDELKVPVLFSLDTIELTAIEGPQINGMETWEAHIDALSLFGDQAYRLASTLSGTRLLVYINRETFLPVQAKVSWAADANNNKQLTALKLGADLALEFDVMFEGWGEPVDVTPPEKYRDLSNFTVSEEGAQIG